MKTLVILVTVAALLTSCGARAVAPPAAEPLGYGTVVGYTMADGTRVRDITLHANPAGQAGGTVGTAHEGDRVAILEERDNGDTLLVRTTGGLIGWTQIDFVKRQ